MYIKVKQLIECFVRADIDSTSLPGNIVGDKLIKNCSVNF